MLDRATARHPRRADAPRGRDRGHGRAPRRRATPRRPAPPGRRSRSRRVRRLGLRAPVRRKTSELIDSYAIPESQDPRFASGFGDLSIHEFATDPTRTWPTAPTTAAASGCSGSGAPAASSRWASSSTTGGSNFWGVEQFTAATASVSSPARIATSAWRSCATRGRGPSGRRRPHAAESGGAERRTGGGKARPAGAPAQADARRRQEPPLQGRGELPGDDRQAVRRHAARRERAERS